MSNLNIAVKCYIYPDNNHKCSWCGVDLNGDIGVLNLDIVKAGEGRSLKFKDLICMRCQATVDPGVETIAEALLGKTFG